jgi:hypothetical protein
MEQLPLAQSGGVQSVASSDVALRCNAAGRRLDRGLPGSTSFRFLPAGLVDRKCQIRSDFHWTSDS